jgi:hypothetical protein
MKPALGRQRLDDDVATTGKLPGIQCCGLVHEAGPRTGGKAERSIANPANGRL